MTAESLRYVWQRADWPALHFDVVAASPALTHAWRLMGQAVGMARGIGIEALDTIAEEPWMQEAVATAVIEASLERSRFWTRPQTHTINERQRRLLLRLLLAGDGGFLGGLDVEKYLEMTDASKATATRDLSDLVRRGLLHASGRGKALRYHVSVPGWTHGLDARPDPTSSNPNPDKPLP